MNSNVHVSGRIGVRSAFTLIELLVVIVIIAILVGLTLAVGGAVVTSGKGRLTTDLIRQTDVAIEQYISATDGLPPLLVAANNPNSSNPANAKVLLPLVDGVDMVDGHGTRRSINSIGIFMLEAENQGMGDLFTGTSGDQMKMYQADRLVEDESAVSGTLRQPELRTILDAWGRPLRFVHPAADGLRTAESKQGQRRTTGDPGGALNVLEASSGTNPYLIRRSRLPKGFAETDIGITSIRRNRLAQELKGDELVGEKGIGDSDGGLCLSDRPYVYSAGEDGNPSTYTDSTRTAAGSDRGVKGDNIYGDVQPKFSDDLPS